MGKHKLDKDKKKEKKRHKHKDRKTKKKEKKDKKDKDKKRPAITATIVTKTKEEQPKVKAEDGPTQANGGFVIPIALMNSKSHAPETQAEYERRQSVIRREKDPVTGRVRLIKGDGEVLEEIVTRERHTDINRAATRGDGEYFRDKTVRSRRSRD